MARSLITVILVAVILALLIPISANLYNSLQAFTPDNLIRINLVAK